MSIEEVLDRDADRWQPEPGGRLLGEVLSVELLMHASTDYQTSTDDGDVY
jgi:hypothetical protein